MADAVQDEAARQARGVAIARWGEDGFFFTEAARGGPLAWRVGHSRLEGDVLGPVRHAHDGAAEYYFMFSGSAYVEVDGEDGILQEGELLFIPPDAPHNFLGPASERDACLFCVVAPNFFANKWRISDFEPDREPVGLEPATPFSDEELPGDAVLSATTIELSKGTPTIEVARAGAEIVYLVISGQPRLSLANGMQGTLRAGMYFHLRQGMAHQIDGSVPSRILRIDCRFGAWDGVPLGAGVSKTE